jgi:hypothetical protein
MPSVTEGLSVALVTTAPTFQTFRWAEWMISRVSGRALVVGSMATVPAEERWAVARGYHVDRLRSDVEFQCRENAQRDVMTPKVCWMIANAIDDTAYHIAERTGTRLGYSRETVRRLERESFMGYVFIRNFLVGECGADYWLACRIAFQMAESTNGRWAGIARRAGAFGNGGERGWL